MINFLVILYTYREKAWIRKAAISQVYDAVHTKSFCLNMEKSDEEKIRTTDDLIKIKFLLIESKLL